MDDYEESHIDITEVVFGVVVEAMNRKLVTLNEREFFDLFHIEENKRDGSCWGGVRENQDGVNEPFVIISAEQLYEAKMWVSDEELDTDSFSPRNLKRYKWGRRGIMLFNEYDDFCEDLEIGDFKCRDDHKFLQCLATHEVAHCLQLWNCEPGWDKQDVHDLHNDVWKKYYRILRRALGLVNKK